MLKGRTIKALSAIFIAAALVIVLALIAQIFGLTMEVCRNTGGYGDNECDKYNTVVALLIKFKNVLNDVSPLVTAIATGFIAWFTIALRDATAEQARLSDRSGEHFRVTERAYVKMSHRTPNKDEPGQAFVWSETDDGAFGVTYEVKNHGRTPARVTATNTAHEILDIDQRLTDTEIWDPVDEDDRSEAFLVCDDRFFIYDNDSISPTEKAAIMAGKKTLLILGFVDYIDQFGVRHRSGYARQYIPSDTDKNNLVFTDGYPGLNYDRIRIRGQGNDWN